MNILYLILIIALISVLIGKPCKKENFNVRNAKEPFDCSELPQGVYKKYPNLLGCDGAV